MSLAVILRMFMPMSSQALFPGSDACAILPFASGRTDVVAGLTNGFASSVFMKKIKIPLAANESCQLR